MRRGFGLRDAVTGIESMPSAGGGRTGSLLAQHHLAAVRIRGCAGERGTGIGEIQLVRDDALGELGAREQLVRLHDLAPEAVCAAVVVLLGGDRTPGV